MNGGLSEKSCTGSPVPPTTNPREEGLNHLQSLSTRHKSPEARSPRTCVFCQAALTYLEEVAGRQAIFTQVPGVTGGGGSGRRGGSGLRGWTTSHRQEALFEKKGLG